MDSVKIYRDKLPSDDVKAMFLKLSRPGKTARLTVFAHGNTESVGRCDPGELAAKLVAHGLQEETVGIRISLVACLAGKWPEGDKDGTDSYAAKFHRILKDVYKIEAVVSARTGTMRVDRRGPFGKQEWVKLVNMTDDPKAPSTLFTHKAPGSKFIWTWEDDKQVPLDRYAEDGK